jgi:hypothetical protein
VMRASGLLAGNMLVAVGEVVWGMAWLCRLAQWQRCCWAVGMDVQELVARKRCRCISGCCCCCCCCMAILQVWEGGTHRWQRA